MRFDLELYEALKTASPIDISDFCKTHKEYTPCRVRHFMIGHMDLFRFEEERVNPLGRPRKIFFSRAKEQEENENHRQQEATLK